jgi:hypothetical protein
MYHPLPGGTEYIELLNIASTNVNISGWTVRGAGNFVFPDGTILPPNGLALLIETSHRSVAQFRADFAVPGSVPIFGHSFLLQNDGETIDLRKLNPEAGAPAISVDRVRYNDKAPWPTEADGAGAALERFNPAAYGNEALNWRAVGVGGSPGRPNQFTAPLLAIAAGTRWNFHDRGYNLGSVWKGTNYVSSGWPSARGPLGYGHPAVQSPVSFGPNAANKHITTYFRKRFVVNDASAEINQLLLRAKYSGGFIAYLNGQEVVRASMPAGSVHHTTLSFGAVAGDYETIDLTSSKHLLRAGQNIFAVEIHLGSAGASDLVWDAELTYTLDSAGEIDSDGDGIPDSWEDLYGLNKNDPNDAHLDLDGDGMTNLEEYLAGTDPTSSASVLAITAVEDVPGGILLRWNSVAGRHYRVQVSEDLENWSHLGDVVTATGSAAEKTHYTSDLRWFYRVVLAP